MRDFGKAPELALIERFFIVPPIMLAVAMYLVGGWPWLVYGFCLPTMTLAHATFAINTVNHMFGSRRFETVDESRNNPFTAFFAVGEGWHNNHHRYQRAARNGFYWWEYDLTWYTIRAMAASAWCGTSSGCRSGSTTRRARSRSAAPPRRCRASSTPARCRSSWQKNQSKKKPRSAQSSLRVYAV